MLFDMLIIKTFIFLTIFRLNDFLIVACEYATWRHGENGGPGIEYAPRGRWAF